MGKDSCFSTALPMLRIGDLVDSCHSDGVKWYLTVVSSVSMSLMANDVEMSLSSCVHWPFGEMSVRILDPFCNWAIYLFIVES